MSKKFEVTLHEIATDGLPDMEKLTGRVAFIFDGCIVSGWPITHEFQPPDRKELLWEGNGDASRKGLFSGVTHWIELPVPTWELA